MAALNQDLRDAFTSKRLVYNHIEESSEDKAFLHKVNSDPVFQSLSRSRPRKPAAQKDADELARVISGSLMGVKICLLPAESQELRKDNSDDSMIKGMEPIGFIVLLDHIASHRNATLGIGLEKEFRGKGYGGEAINWALDWAFHVAGLHRVQLDCFSYNPRALHMYRKLGFVEEGRQREALYYERNWHDIVNFAMLEQEWEKLRGLK